jgi:Uma2 family endonuclease
MAWRYDAGMSHAVETREDSAPARARFTRLEYGRMADAGVFEGRRVELLDGEVMVMTPQGSAHASALARIMRVLATALGDRAALRPQLPLGLDDHSEPEPDVVVCRPDLRDYADRHPEAADVWLVVEVSDASLAYDRGPKTTAYAKAGIPTFWIVNIQERCLEVHQDPEPALGRYRSRARLEEKDQVAIPAGAPVSVSSLLPPP